jgi:septal ring factor EnvC (AmiA/AmiB activator)
MLDAGCWLKMMICAGLILFMAGVCGAQSSSKIERFKKEAKAIDRKIEKNKAEVNALSQKENAVISKLNETDYSLSKAQKRVSALRAELAALEKQLAETAEQSEKLKQDIRASEDYASRRTAALYKLSCLGKIHVLASADSVSDFFQRKKSLERILAHDQNLLESLAGQKAELQEILDSLNARKKEKLSLEADFKAQIGVMSRKKAERSNLLKDIRKKKSLTLAAIESLKQSAKELDQKIKSLILESRRASPPEKVLSGKFGSQRGLLNMPAEGKIISFFGPYKNKEFNVQNVQKGIDIKSEKGNPIRAVCEGRVIYSGWFKSYGNMLIIDHGNHYYTLYAHADEIFKAEGDRAEAGEVIATVGDTGSIKGPVLHFEVRHHGKAIDPLKWLRKN